MEYLRRLLSEWDQRALRHFPVREQVINLNRVLRGHYAYFGIAGNMRALQKVHRNVERYWRTMLNRRNREGRVTWEVFQRIKSYIRYSDRSLYFHIQSCRLLLCCESMIEERSAGNSHATICGNRRRVTASDDLVGLLE